MERKHEFYPMFTYTVKSILKSASNDNISLFECVNMIIEYPKKHIYKNIKDSPIHDLLMNELDRQYDRWSKGVNNAVQKH